MAVKFPVIRARLALLPLSGYRISRTGDGWVVKYNKDVRGVIMRRGKEMVYFSLYDSFLDGLFTLLGYEMHRKDMIPAGASHGL
jgi:hypothetical protein